MSSCCADAVGANKGNACVFKMILMTTIMMMEFSMFSFKVLHFFYKNAASLSVFGCKRVETLTPQQLEHLRIEKENREIDRLSFIVVVAGCKKRKKAKLGQQP